MLRLELVAHPGARQERVELDGEGVLGVWVRQRPVDGQANAAIERALADALGLRPRQVQLVAGHTSRRKIVELELDDLHAVRARLMAHGVRSG